jgi:hypothetical protein
MVFNPANYYLHSMFLLVTLAAEHPVSLGPRTSWRGSLVWLTLLAMCVGSYFTNLSTDGGMHFRTETWVCFGTLGLLLALELFRPSEKEAVSAA